MIDMCGTLKGVCVAYFMHLKRIVSEKLGIKERNLFMMHVKTKVMELNDN